MKKMKWIKSGKIFDPTNHGLEDFDCDDFAQSPQALVFDNFVRIYFSTRKKDGDGMFLSVIRFVDYSKDFKSILAYSKKEVVSLGDLGTFDEHGIFPFSPLSVDNDVIAYTCGWSRRKSVPVETSTGYVKSFDNGETFVRIGKGPILTNSVNEPFLVGDSFVKKFGNVYHMWYIFGKKWMNESIDEPTARIYKIAHAQSNNSIDWKKDEAVQIISDRLDENECQALPSVVFFKGLYHMVFCYRYATDFRNNPDRGYKLGYANSKDLITWTRNDEAIEFSSDTEWDRDMVCYPNIFEMDNELFLLYNGNLFGKFGFGIAQLKYS